MTMNVDDVYATIGELGWFQKRVLLVYCLSMIFVGGQMVQNVLVGALPETSELVCEVNQAVLCSPSCPRPSVLTSFEYLSYAIEWKLICSPKQVESTQSIFMFGVMIGSSLMGGLADRHGRLPTLLISYSFACFLAFTSTFATSWSIYAALRFLTGLSISGILIVGFVLTSELVGPSRRSIVSTSPSLFFAFGVCFQVLVASKSGEWRLTSGVLGFTGFPIIPALWWVYLESPHWCLSQGNISRCKMVLQQISAINGTQLGEIELRVNPYKEVRKHSSLLDLLSHPVLLKLTLIQLFSWFSITCVYYGLTLAAGSMGSDRYISLMLSSLVEVPSNILVNFVMNMPRFGRVKTCVATMLMSSVCCALIMLIPDGGKGWVILLACLGKFCIVMSFAVIYSQGAELYPTPIRNNALGALAVSSRMGGVLSPQLLTLSLFIKNLHFLAFALLGFISGFFCSLLPETLGRPLPETLEDIYSSHSQREQNVSAMKHGPVLAVGQERLLAPIDEPTDE